MSASRQFPDLDFKQPRAVVLAPPRELGFWFFSLSKQEGGGTPKGAPWVNGRGLFPGSPENRSTRQRLSALHRGDLLAPVRASGDVAALGARARRFRAARLSPSSQLQWQTLLMGPDGNPKPPECAEHRLLPARRRRSHPHIAKRPRQRPLLWNGMTRNIHHKLEHIKNIYSINREYIPCRRRLHHCESKLRSRRG